MPRSKPGPTEGLFTSKDGSKYKTAAALASHERSVAKKAAGQAAQAATTTSGAPAPVKTARPTRVTPPAPPDALSMLRNLKSGVPQTIKAVESRLAVIHKEEKELTEGLAHLQAITLGTNQPAPLTHTAGN